MAATVALNAFDGAVGPVLGAAMQRTAEEKEMKHLHLALPVKSKAGNINHVSGDITAMAGWVDAKREAEKLENITLYWVCENTTACFVYLCG